MNQMKTEKSISQNEVYEFNSNTSTIITNAQYQTDSSDQDLHLISHSKPLKSANQVTTSLNKMKSPPHCTKTASLRRKSSSNQNHSNATLFENLAYVGSVSIDAPKDRAAIIECIKLFDNTHPNDQNINSEKITSDSSKICNSNSQNQPLMVTMSVPDSCQHSVVIYEQSTRNEISRFKISRIMFCARGEEASSEENYFAFTCSHGRADTPLDALFKCHIFKCCPPPERNKDDQNLSQTETCKKPIRTGDILLAFAKAFRKPVGSESNNMNKFLYPPNTNHKEGNVTDTGEEVSTRVLAISLEIKEAVNKGGQYSPCPLDGPLFKLRHNLEKRLSITVHSFSPPTSAHPTNINPGRFSSFLDETTNLHLNQPSSIDESTPPFLEDHSCPHNNNNANYNSSPTSTTTSNYLNNGLVVERCFGIHITPGTDFNQNKLHMLDIVSMNHDDDSQYLYNIVVLWDPKEYNMDEFVVFSQNKEYAYLVFTLGLDLIFAGVQEPIRLLLNVKGRLYPENEKFWYYLSKQRVLRESYYVELKKMPSDLEFHVSNVKSHSQLSRFYSPKSFDLTSDLSTTNNTNLGSNLNNILSVNGTSIFAALPSSLLKPSLLMPKFLHQKSTQVAGISSNSSVSPHTPNDGQTKDDFDRNFIDDSDNDEPMLSGTGDVKRDCENSELEAWAEILTEWRANIERRPKKIPTLCQKGIPDALRGEVWQLLAKTFEDQDKVDIYKELLMKESIYEKVIVSDIYRTFPAHDYFKRRYEKHSIKMSPDLSKPMNNMSNIRESLKISTEKVDEDKAAIETPVLPSNGFLDHTIALGTVRSPIDETDDFIEIIHPSLMNDNSQIIDELEGKTFSKEQNKDDLISNNKEENNVINLTELEVKTNSQTDLRIPDIPNNNNSLSEPANESSLLDDGGGGQECLYRLIKAYSVYDTEIGYCQGLSFLAASLLLHMPEEQAFCLLVKIMYAYDLRNLFKQGFQELQLKFYQLDRLIQENLPALHAHFADIGIEVHMFASQWFLTIVTAKFPLNIVFNILDVFLCHGMMTIFAVSLALLKLSERELLHLDFEDVLKYFRVSLPKKFRNERAAARMMEIAGMVKISNKKLKKYEKEYVEIKEREQFEKDPFELLKKENLLLKEANMRLERENDLLAQELVASKIRLRNDLDATEDTAESLSLELEQTTKSLREFEEENKRLLLEIQKIKEMYRKEIEKSDVSSMKSSTDLIQENGIL